MPGARAKFAEIQESRSACIFKAGESDFTKDLKAYTERECEEFLWDFHVNSHHNHHEFYDGMFAHQKATAEI